METLEYTRIICEIWTYWRQYPVDFTDFEAYLRDVEYILYRITGHNYFITKSDSDVINTIIDSVLGVGSEFGYESSRGLSKTGGVIGGIAAGTLGAIGTLSNTLINQEDYFLNTMRVPVITGTILSGAGIGFHYGAKMGAYTKISSDEDIYDMTDTTFINNPNFVFGKLIEIFKPSLKFNRNHLPPLEYIIYVFDLMLNWSQFNAFKTRFVDFGKLYIDPILHRIANPPKPGMVRGVKTLRELSYDTANKNYTYEDIISKIGEEPYLQATSNFRDVYED